MKKEDGAFCCMYEHTCYNVNVFSVQTKFKIFCNSKVKDGVAKLADTGMSEFENLSRGIIITRPIYTAPEVLDGRPFSFSADIFSLAILAWEMWYGRRVFSENVYSEVMHDYSSIKVNTCMVILSTGTGSTYMFLLRNVEMKNNINKSYILKRITRSICVNFRQ